MCEQLCVSKFDEAEIKRGHLFISLKNDLTKTNIQKGGFAAGEMQSFLRTSCQPQSTRTTEFTFSCLN